MTFEQFTHIVNEKRPEITVFKHGDFSTTKTLNVAVIFNKGTAKESKVYNYHGTYIQVLNRLNIPTMTSCDLWQYEAQLIRAKREHGEPFGDSIIDNTELIKELEKEIIDIKQHYVII